MSMKPIVAFLIVFSFFGIAVFGFAQTNDGMPIKCVAAAAGTMNCPQTANPFAFAGFHVDALKTFSQAPFGQNLSILALFLAALFLVIAMRVLAWRNFRLFPAFSSFHLRNLFELPILGRVKWLIGWLCLRENSPALF